MKTFRCLAVTLCACLFTGGALRAQTIDPKLKIQTFFNIMVQGDVGKAYDALFNGSNIAARKPDAINVLRKQSEMGTSLYGKTLGCDLIDNKAYGTSVQRFVYVQKLEKYLLVWEFFYYKADRDWNLVDVRFSDKLDLLRPSESLLAEDNAAPGTE